MNSTIFFGLILNFILYFFAILPIIIISFNKKLYNKKDGLLFAFSFITILEIFISLGIHFFARSIFSLFSKTPGVVNYAVYASKIIFITGSLYAIKFLVPFFLYNNKNSFLTHKKTTILFSSKIVVNLVLAILGFLLFSIKGSLYSIPLCDLIYYIIYIILFIKVK